MTFINTNGMAFFGPGSEWFWAALQFTALLITFIAIYRQLRIGQSQRAVEQVEGYSRLFENERMIRLKLGTLVALRDGTGISLNVGVPIANYLEDMAALCKRGHLDIKLLWNSLSEEAEIWWFVLQPMVKAARALMGATSYDNWEWLVGDFIEMIGERAVTPPSTPNGSTTGSQAGQLNATKIGFGWSRRFAQSSSPRRTVSSSPNQRPLYRQQLQLEMRMQMHLPRPAAETPKSTTRLTVP